MNYNHPEPGLLKSCSSPTTLAGAEVKADQAGSTVIAAGDVAEGDVAVVNITGIDHNASISRASRPHGRTQADTPTCHQPLCPLYLVVS